MITYLSLIIILLLSPPLNSGPGEGSRSNCNRPEHLKALRGIVNNIIINEISKSLSKTIVELGKNNYVLILGEVHVQSLPKQAISSHLNSLYSLGYRKLALEMMNSSGQKKLSQFCNDEIAEDEFQFYWKKHWGYRNQDKNYFKLIKTACDLGFFILAVDGRDDIDFIKSKMK